MKRNQMREAKTLAKTYYDRLDVYRYQLIKDGDSGETRQKKILVYKNQKFAVSMSGNEAPERGTVVDDSSSTYTLFTDPEIRMQENDLVVIRTFSGQIYEGRTGKTYVAISHGETSLKVDKIV